MACGCSAQCSRHHHHLLLHGVARRKATCSVVCTTRGLLLTIVAAEARRRRELMWESRGREGTEADEEGKKANRLQQDQIKLQHNQINCNEGRIEEQKSQIEVLARSACSSVDHSRRPAHVSCTLLLPLLLRCRKRNAEEGVRLYRCRSSDWRDERGGGRRALGRGGGGTRGEEP